jgi:predicted GNAT family acetyltransferase
MTDDDLRVTDNPERHRFEAHLDGRVVAISTYRLVDDRIVFRHTETDDALEGRGIGSRLVREALDDVRGRNLRVTADCPFVSSWIDRHPDYRDLLAAG